MFSLIIYIFILVNFYINLFTLYKTSVEIKILYIVNWEEHDKCFLVLLNFDIIYNIHLVILLLNVNK